MDPAQGSGLGIDVEGSVLLPPSQALELIVPKPSDHCKGQRR